jgi:uncharacterized protein YwqG
MNKADDFRERLERAGLSYWADQIIALDRPSIRLRSEPLDGFVPLGTSRLGGDPDLPASASWPEWKGKPLCFVAQIALGELPRVPDQDLPADGLLAFFYDAEQQVWGFDPADRGGWRVLWSEPHIRLERRPASDGVPANARYRPCQLTPTVELTHASPEEADIERLGMPRDEWFRYAELFDEEDVTPIHRLLGHPQPVQGGMQLECQLVTNGLYCGDASAYQDPRASTLRPGAVDWRLLLQIDSDDEAGMMWGDDGRLYYWITAGALARRDWESTWLVLECS